MGFLSVLWLNAPVAFLRTPSVILIVELTAMAMPLPTQIFNFVQTDDDQPLGFGATAFGGFRVLVDNFLKFCYCHTYNLGQFVAFVKLYFA